MKVSRGPLRERLETTLLCGYVAFLVALPTDVGFDVGWMVVTPARLLLVSALLAALSSAVFEHRGGPVLPG